MNRIYHRRWLRFAKGGKTKYIGHLDLMKVFQGAIRRAKLPIAYSMGFNPHQRLSFALPLPLGMDSACEYMELLLDEPIAPDALCPPLQAQLPDGLVLLSAYEASEQAPRPAAAVMAADYRLVFPGVAEAAPHLQALLAAPSIPALKKSKGAGNAAKEMKEVDIRPDILALSYEAAGAVALRLSAGSTRNLSPQLAAQALFDRMAGPAPQAHEIALVRRALYALRDGNLVPLHEVAQ